MLCKNSEEMGTSGGWKVPTCPRHTEPRPPADHRGYRHLPPRHQDAIALHLHSSPHCFDREIINNGRHQFATRTQRYPTPQESGGPWVVSPYNF